VRRPIQVILALTAIAAAFQIGRHTGPPEHYSTRTRDPVWSDFQGRTLVSNWDKGAGPTRAVPNEYELAPYRMVVDGNRVFDSVDSERKSEDIWQIKLADDRIVIFAVRRTPQAKEDQP